MGVGRIAAIIAFSCSTSGGEGIDEQLGNALIRGGKNTTRNALIRGRKNTTMGKNRPDQRWKEYIRNGDG
jgi:hypothetical protein